MFSWFLLLALQSCTSDYTKNLGSGYFYRFEAIDLRDIHCEKAKGGEVPADILEYAFNRDYIIAKQKPRLPQDPIYSNEYIYENGDNVIYYWIIIKRDDIILGPLNLDSFNKKANTLNLPKTMLSKIDY